MEDINKFLGGMNTDVHPFMQPENTLRRALNFVPLTKEGNLYSITNESGTVLYDNISFPNGFQVIGYTVLGRDIIVILVHPDGYSQIGYIVEDSNALDVTYQRYHPVAPVDPGTGVIPENNSELGFTIDRPVDCVARKLINGHRVLYFTDNFNPFGRVDLENPPEVGTVKDQVKLTFNQTIPSIQLSTIRENVASTIRPGVYQFITRYITNSGGETTFGIPSNPIPMVPTPRSVGPDNYHGEFYETQTVNKNIELTISNIDTQYQELEVIAIYYEGSQSVFKASVVAQLPITEDTLDFTFTGPDTEAEVVLTREELRKIPISYTRAKCIEQKDNQLFLSNLSSDRQDSDEALQEVANNIRVKYRIDERQFSGRGNNTQISNLLFTTLGNPFISGITALDISFSEDVDVTSGENVNNYLLNKPGVAAQGSIEITNSSLIADGDTITIGAGPSQPSVVFTGRTSSPGVDEFLIVPGDNEQTAFSIMEAINNSANVTEYFAYLTGATVTLVWNSIDLAANGVTINASSASGVTTSNFSGASTTAFDEVPTSATVSGSTVTLEFANSVSTSDTLQIIGDIENFDQNEVYQTGTNGSLSIITEPATSGSEAFDIGFTDYTNEQLTFDSKGYRRGEVYSLGFCLVYKDGSTSFVYHIPGFHGYVDDVAFGSGTNKFSPTGADVWPSFSTSPTSTGFCGTYVSTIEYPLDQNYPGNEPGDDSSTQGPGVNTARNVRHHLMPSLSNEPHFRRDASGNTLIRILHLEFEFGQSIPTNILEDVSQIMFVRERRNTDQNRSMLAQGLINRQVIQADDYTNSGQVEGSAINAGTYGTIKSGYYATEMLFFNNGTSAQFLGDVEVKSSGRTDRGTVYPNYSGLNSSGTYATGERLNSEILENRAFFHSPETNLLSGFRFDGETVIGANMIPELLLRGDYERVNFAYDRWEYDSPGTKGTEYLTKYMFADHFADYNDYVASVSGSARTIERARYAEPGKRRLDALDPNNPIRTGTRWTQGGLELKVDNNFTNPGGSTFIPNNTAQIRDVSGTGCISDCEGFYDTSDVLDSVGGSTGGGRKTDRLRRYLYNLSLNNAQQYGQLSLASYIPIEITTPFLPNGSFKTTYAGVYGGDTFITKYAFNTGNLLIYWPYKRDGDASINRPNASASQRPGGYNHTDGVSLGGSTSGGPGLAHGWDFRCTSYYFVESNINTHYRHRPSTEQKQNYFPNESNLSVLLNDYFPYLGNIQAYNTQYSYENNIKEFFIKGSTQSVITEFENRTIYSEKASEDDTLDSYRSFLQNNYYDLPANTGPIWDTFVEYGTLFMHTPKSLWRTFAEPAATIKGGNISDVVLGTGNLFARPSTEMLTTSGGYAGSISQFGGAHTQIGYIFPDVLQGKVFGIVMGNSGPYLKEMSLEGLQTYMHTNLPINIIQDPITGEIDLSRVTTSFAHMIDNPFKGIGICGGYDYKLRRYFMVKHGDNPFTVTFSTVIQKWMSFHSYMPHIIIPYDNRVFFLRNFDDQQQAITIDMWEMNNGDKGSYFGTVYNSELEYVSATNKNQAKTYQNLIIGSDSTNRVTGVKVRDDNFQTLQVYTDRHNTGVYTLIHGNSFNPTKNTNETFVKFRNDEYRIAIPRDAVVDNSQDIFNIANLNQTQTYRERIKGDYAHFKLVYDNTDNREFVLNFISTIFNVNVR